LKALVVGYGSIGARHARLLGGLGHEVAVVSRRPQDGIPCYPAIADACRAFAPEYVVIASRTREHADDMAALAGTGFDGIVLMEKPLFDRAVAVPANDFAAVHVAFNLRFHPALLRFRDILADRAVFAMHAYAGQYLPDWRPGTDYRQSYSARKAEGGGVLRDLSHELDFMNWLLGGWTSLTALGGHVSDLEIDSDDAFSILFETRTCRVATVSLNYLDSTLRRDVLALTDRGSVQLDFVKSTVTADGKTEHFDVDRDETFIAEHRAALGSGADLCSLDEGLAVMRMIDACEQTAASRQWVSA